jgi:methionine synthase II (cobalamin-independent)
MAVLPTLQTAMIGSMPQLNSDDALALLEKYPLSFPTWPQLPKTSFKEAMIPQYSEGFPGIKIDENEKKIWVEKDDELINSISSFFENIVENNYDALAISNEYAKGFHSFYEKYKEKGTKLPFVKGQITGPFTFGLGLNDNEKKSVWYDEQYKEVVINGLKFKALWQYNKLKEISEKVIIFLDEPILSALGTSAYLSIQDKDVIEVINEITDSLKQQGIIAGIHCCGNTDWGLITKCNIDILAFDAYYYGDRVSLYINELKSFLEKGRILAFGIVPTSDATQLNNESKDGLVQKISDLINNLEKKGINKELIKNQIIFTPSCGFGSGSLSIEESELVLKLLSEIKGCEI